LLYEYALVADNIVLLVILYFLNTRKQYPKIINISVTLVIFIKMSLIVMLPVALYGFSSPPRDFLHLIFIDFIYTIIWMLWLYFLLLKKDVKHDYQTIYIKNIRLYGSLLVLSNLLIFGLQTLNIYISYFSFDFFYTISLSLPDSLISFSLLSKIIGFVFVIYSYVFILMVLNRTMKLIRIFGFLFFLLFILVSVQWINFTSVYLGWYESLETFITLFSFSYGYVGLAVIFLLGIVIFTHFASILLYILSNSLSESGRHKNHMLYLIKCSYISNLLLLLLMIFPLFI
jgi:hypothetical protein